MPVKKKQYDVNVVLGVFSLFKEVKQLAEEKSDPSLIVQIIAHSNYSNEQLDAVITSFSSSLKKSNPKKRKSNDDKRLSEHIEAIKDRDSLREYYFGYLKGYFTSDTSEDVRKQIISSISINDLRYLYSLISNVKLPQSRKKPDILSLLRTFFENESRTNSLKF